MQSILQKRGETNFINQEMLKYGSLLQHDEDDYTAKRNHHRIEIRKSNRDQIFLKKRIHLQNEKNDKEIEKNDTNVEIDYNLLKKRNYDYVYEDRIKGILGYYQQVFQIEDLDQLIQELLDDDIKLKHHAAVGIRKILSVGSYAPIQAIIDAGLVKILLQLAQQKEWPQLQIQSTWILTNIASGTADQCRVVIEDGGIPILVSNLRGRKEIIMHAVWALGNITSDCPHYRDLVTEADTINLVSDFLSYDLEYQKITQSCWLLSNLCRGFPLPKYEKIQPAIKTICMFIGSGVLNEKFDSFGDCLWAISYNCNGLKKQEEIILESKIMGKIIPFLANNSCRAHLKPILRIVGNFATGNGSCTQQLLENNLLAAIYQLISSPNETIRRQACWILSNVTASTYEHNMQVFQSQDLMMKIVDMFSNETDQGVKKELCFVFSNMTYMNRKADIKLDQYLIQKGILKGYLKIIQEQTDNHKLLQTVLNCLYEIFMDSEKWKGQKKNCAVTMYVLQQNKVQILEKLQYSADGLYFQVNRILQNFFETDDPLERL